MEIPTTLHVRAVLFAYLITIGFYFSLNLLLLGGMRLGGGIHFVADDDREAADEKMLRNPCQRKDRLTEDLCAALKVEERKKHGLQIAGLEQVLEKRLLSDSFPAAVAGGAFKGRGDPGQWRTLLRRRLEGSYWNKVWLPFGMLEIAKPDRLVASVYTFVPSEAERSEKRIDALKKVQNVNGVLDWYVARLDEDESSATWRRVIRFFNGFIQWTTVFVAAWSLMLLRYRRAWARIEAFILEGERLPALIPEYERVHGVWAAKEDGDHTHVFRAIQRLGASILPFRLIRDLRRDYRAGRSDHAAEGIRAIADHYRQQVDTGEWTLIRWQLAVIPMLGFVGTVYGMIMAMGGVGGIIGVSDEEVGRQMDVLSRHLGTAFDTTLLALVLSIGLERLAGRVFAEESAVFDALAHQGVNQLGTALPELMRAERIA